MKIEFEMGPYTEIIEVSDDESNEKIDEMFEIWLWNRTDIGWSKVEE